MADFCFLLFTYIYEIKASCNLFKSEITSLDFLAVIIPPISKDTEANTLPSLTIIIPPFIFFNSCTANSISESLVPQTIKLWESCAIVVAIAPDLRFNPFKTPRPTFPVFLWRSITAIFNKLSFVVKLTNSLLRFNLDISSLELIL